jgi:hypothetical protein
METGHLTGGEVAGYLEGTLPPADRRRVEAHLAACDECCIELIEVAPLLRTRPRWHRRQGIWIATAGVAAAAAVLLLIMRQPTPPAESPGYREPVVTPTLGPVIIAPRGVTAARTVVWTAVPHAERYRLTLFDATGTGVWESQASDTFATLPTTIELRPSASYFWRVEAQTGWNRWVKSDLVEFSVSSPRP